MKLRKHENILRATPVEIGWCSMAVFLYFEKLAHLLTRLRSRVKRICEAISELTREWKWAFGSMWHEFTTRRISPF